MQVAIDTRDESYRQVLPSLGRRQFLVLAVIRGRGPISDRAVAKVLGIPVNRVTGRRNELVAAGYVVSAGKEFDAETDRKVHLWRAVA